MKYGTALVVAVNVNQVGTLARAIFAKSCNHDRRSLPEHFEERGLRFRTTFSNMLCSEGVVSELTV
jgi:hypothetical protein